MKRRSGTVVLAVFAVLVAGCGSDRRGSVEPVATTPGPSGTQSSGDRSSGDQPGTDTSPTTPPGWSLAPGPSLQPVPAPTSLPVGAPLDHDMALVQDAVDDLAARLGVDRAEVTVVEALAVTWPDGSLGCPQPGMQYIQRLTDGALVILEAAGRPYEYHGGDPLVLCEQPRSAIGPGASISAPGEARSPDA